MVNRQVFEKKDKLYDAVAKMQFIVKPAEITGIKYANLNNKTPRTVL